MTPTLLGRLQLRLFTALMVGAPLTVFVSWLAGVKLAFFAIGLASAVVVGLACDCLYQLLQRLRWDRDWPPLFFLLGAVAEFASVLLILWLILPASVFSIMYISLHFWSIWLGSITLIFHAFHIVQPFFKYSAGHIVRRSDITSRL